jgi:hypothetical protein
LVIQQRPTAKKQPLKKSSSHAASVNQIAFPMDARPTALIRALATKKRTRSKMKAKRVTTAAKPEIHVLQQAIDISRTWARRPKMAEMAARTRPITWRKSA